MVYLLAISQLSRFCGGFKSNVSYPKMTPTSGSCYDVREYMDILNDERFVHETEEQKILFVGPSGKKLL